VARHRGQLTTEEAQAERNREAERRLQSREIPKVKFRSIGPVDGAGVNLELKASSALRHATIRIGEDLADNVPVISEGQP